MTQSIISSGTSSALPTESKIVFASAKASSSTLAFLLIEVMAAPTLAGRFGMMRMIFAASPLPSTASFSAASIFAMLTPAAMDTMVFPAAGAISFRTLPTAPGLTPMIMMSACSASSLLSLQMTRSLFVYPLSAIDSAIARLFSVVASCIRIWLPVPTDDFAYPLRIEPPIFPIPINPTFI